MNQTNEDIILASQILGYTGGLLVIFLNIPLMVKVIKEKSSKSLSTPYLLLNLLTSFVYISYGILINQWPVIGSNIGFCVIVIILISLKIYYDNFNKKKNKKKKTKDIEN